MPAKKTDPTTIKPNHKAIQQYYQSLKDFSGVGVKHEGAVETAFQRLLEHIAKIHHCQLIPKHKLKVGSHLIYPDGTVFEKELGDLGLRLGYWEAKDIDDDLDRAIASKVASKYPLNNTIFENTRKAVLYQGGKPRDQFDLADKKQLADLLNEFFAYHEPEIANFHDAIAEFKDRVPDLAKGLVGKLDDAHKNNKKFQTAFDSFLTVCQQTLNPNISRAAVDEMLVQHLLTERLIRKIFDNPEFMHRNVIAAEIEKVIDALVSHSFNRDVFLRSLDRFYRAIEDAAHTLEDFAEKQHFLNTVYERFFQGYSVKVADTHGIVYTPQEIVDFMCASVEEVLKTEFNLTLGSKGVNILDPCTGTGNFIVNLINRIPKKDLPRVYKEQLFANEVMLLPYYIAALNIEHAYWERTGQYEAFDGLCFADTLDMTEDEYVSLFTEENTARIRRQKKTPITVIVGNPPYNVGQLSENDNNKNRSYPQIEKRIKATYAADSAATLKTQLYDPYVKFIRWAVDRLGGRDGIVCLVTNNSFVDQFAFDGMRKHLMQDFSRIYHLNLEGNVRQNPKLAGTIFNVFGIQVGVGITVAVKTSQHADHRLFFHRIDKLLRKESKLAELSRLGSASGVEWLSLTPDSRNTWLVSEHSDEFAVMLSMGDKETKKHSAQTVRTIFKTYSGGILSRRDDVVYDFQKGPLTSRMEKFTEAYNSEVDRLKRAKAPINIDEFVNVDLLKWDAALKRNLELLKSADFDHGRVRVASYRPFTKRFLYFDKLFNSAICLQHHFFPPSACVGDNHTIWLKVGSEWPMFSIMVNDLVDFLPQGGCQCFPFYVYDEDGSNRRENITDWALEQFRTHYGEASRERKRPEEAGETANPSGRSRSRLAGDRDITKWDIFYYVYGILHHPGYRTKFADNLKRELPRIPYAPPLTPGPSPTRGEGGNAASAFWAFSDAGRELARLHLDYEKLEPFELTFIETEGMPLSYRVEKMKLSKDKSSLNVNPSLTLAGIPPEVFQYRLGNRSALDWVIDQYQVSEDKRSGIKSDPNRADDPEYIVRLVGQVVRVSVETVRIVKALPERYA